MAGWTKAWRKELESNIWDMPPVYHRVFVWLRHKVTMKPYQLNNGIMLSPGQVFTTHGRIAQGVGWTERGVEKVPNRKTVMAVLAWLEEQQTITCEGDKRGTLITLLNWGTYQSAGEREGQPNGQPDGQPNGHRTRSSKKEEKKTYVLPAHLDTESFRAAWVEWERHRGEIKKRLTPTTVSRQVKFLEPHDEQTAIAIIEQSVSNGWTGLFELKGKGGQDAGRTSSSHGKGQGASRFGDYSDDEGRFRRDI